MADDPAVPPPPEPAAAGAAFTSTPAGKAAVIKKYANRRLYNTATSSYVTLDELAAMVRRNVDFHVFDAKSGDDITRSVLTQIILEEDSKGRNLLPIPFLRQLIGFYDDSVHSVHAVLPRYLEMSMDSFSRNQTQFRSYLNDTVGRFFPIQQMEDLTRQNLAMFQRATAGLFPGIAAEPPATAAPEAPSPDGERRAELDELRSKLDRLERQLEALHTPRDRDPQAD